MMKSAKIIIFTLFFSLLFGLFTQKTFALAPNSDYLQFEKALSSNDMNLESFVANTFTSLINTGINQLFGCISCKEGKPLFADASPSSFGAIGMMSYLISMPYTNLPASSIDYVADIGNRFNITKEARAQDNTGYSEMKPSMPLWKTFRNISYSLMAIILVFIAFAMMFRLKISPQATVTLQSAIPSIIISLVLITFSYAIVGFMLDMVWVINNLLLNVFATLFKPLNNFAGINFGEGGSSILLSGGIITDAWSLFGKMFTITLLPFFLGFLTILSLSIVPLGVVGFVPVAGWGAAGVLVVIILLIFAIICLLALFRTFTTLIKAYINIVLSLIFAPFIILMGAIPGRGSIISGWFTGLIGNLLTLPVILVMILTGSYIICATWSQYANILFPVTGMLDTLANILGAVGHMNPSQQAQIFLSVFAGIGIMLMTPKAADIIQAFFSGKAFAYGTALGEVISSGKGLGMAGLQYGGSREESNYKKTQAEIVDPNSPVRVVPGDQQKLHEIYDMLRQLKWVK